jgi:hypothetical protein
MNEDELRRNPVLTDFVVHDLNIDPKLPYEDNSFDVRATSVYTDPCDNHARAQHTFHAISLAQTLVQFGSILRTLICSAGISIDEALAELAGNQ